MRTQLKVLIVWAIVFSFAYLISAGIYWDVDLVKCEVHHMLTIVGLTWLLMSVLIYLINSID